MFDTYCVPMAIEMSECGTFESQSKKPIIERLDGEVIKTWMNRVEETLNLQKGDLLKKHKSKRPMKLWKGVNLSELRRAMVVHIYDTGDIKVTELGNIMEVDHSSISVMRKDGSEYAKQKDEKFMQYYNVVKTLPIKDCGRLQTAV